VRDPEAEYRVEAMLSITKWRCRDNICPVDRNVVSIGEQTISLDIRDYEKI